MNVDDGLDWQSNQTPALETDKVNPLVHVVGKRHFMSL